MIEVHRRTSASPDEVWALLADGWTYSTWVVGTSRIRAVGAGWPAVGAELDHSAGAWPLLINDSTTVIDADPPRRLTLQARGWPFGEATVRVELEPRDGGCLITLREDATVGPARFVPYPLRKAVLAARNAETLRRLAYLAERRST